MQAAFTTAAQRSVLKLTTSAFLDRAAMRGVEAIVDQMAEDCRVFAANTDSVTADDLELIGWTPAQITLHGRNAARRANARASRQS
jgi:hypothetical protein